MSENEDLVQRFTNALYKGQQWIQTASDEEVAKAVDNAILSFLEAENVRYTTITGSTKERSEKILEILNITDGKDVKLDMAK